MKVEYIMTEITFYRLLLALAYISPAVRPQPTRTRPENIEFLLKTDPLSRNYYTALLVKNNVWFFIQKAALCFCSTKDVKDKIFVRLNDF